MGKSYKYSGHILYILYIADIFCVCYTIYKKQEVNNVHRSAKKGQHEIYS